MGATAQIVGRLTRDPELRTTPSGLAIAGMRVAVDRAGDKQDDGSYASGFFDVTVFGNQAENCAQYLAKGREVAVFGRLRFHEWEAKDGSGKRSRVEIDANDVRFIGGKGDAEAAAGGSDDQGADDSDDIPFMPTIDGLGN